MTPQINQSIWINVPDGSRERRDNSEGGKEKRRYEPGERVHPVTKGEFVYTDGEKKIGWEGERSTEGIWAAQALIPGDGPRKRSPTCAVAGTQKRVGAGDSRIEIIALK
jgi:hypothetical protein